jgi:hypothetical protein
MRFWAALFVLGIFMAPQPALAQTDEIQVYDGGLAEPGVFNLTWHNNFTPSGEKTPAFPGAVVANRSFNGVTEWAYGVTEWFEAGLYLPLYTHDKSSGWEIDGFKLRTLFAVPHAGDRRFFYGANFEFSVNEKWWEEKRFTSEVRPIVGWHLKPVDIIINPILDTSYDGIKRLVFAPATRVAYGVSSQWTLAAEEYADYGPLNNLASGSQQVHQLYAVVDHSGGGFEIEAGIGVGLTNATDKLTFKLLVAHDFNKPRQTKP